MATTSAYPYPANRHHGPPQTHRVRTRHPKPRVASATTRACSRMQTRSARRTSTRSPRRASRSSATTSTASARPRARTADQTRPPANHRQPLTLTLTLTPHRLVIPDWSQPDPRQHGQRRADAREREGPRLGLCGHSTQHDGARREARGRRILHCAGRQVASASPAPSPRPARGASPATIYHLLMQCVQSRPNPPNTAGTAVWPRRRTRHEAAVTSSRSRISTAPTTTGRHRRKHHRPAADRKYRTH